VWFPRGPEKSPISDALGADPWAPKIVFDDFSRTRPFFINYPRDVRFLCKNSSVSWIIDEKGRGAKRGENLYFAVRDLPDVWTFSELAESGVSCTRVYLRGVNCVFSCWKHVGVSLSMPLVSAQHVRWPNNVHNRRTRLRKLVEAPALWVNGAQSISRAGIPRTLMATEPII